MAKHESLKPEAELEENGLQLLSENNTVQINHCQNPDRCQGEWGAVRSDARSDAPVTWEFCHNTPPPPPPQTPVLIGEWLTSSWETCPWTCQGKQTTASVLQELFQMLMFIQISGPQEFLSIMFCKSASMGQNCWNGWTNYTVNNSTTRISALSDTSQS